MIISSTLVMKTSDSSSFLTTRVQRHTAAHPCVQSNGDSSPPPFCGDLVFQRPTFLEQSSDIGSILQPFQGVNYNLKGILLLVK